jgi:small subunit ribosomal protein S21
MDPDALGLWANRTRVVHLSGAALSHRMGLCTKPNDLDKPGHLCYPAASASGASLARQAFCFPNSRGFAAEKDRCVQVLVRDNNVDQALKALKKKMQREGIFREMKLRGHYEKPSEKRAREKAEAVRRARKLARKKMQREGLLPMKPKPVPGAR